MCVVRPAGPVRPNMSETTALGAAMAAGAAEGVGVWSLKPDHLPHMTSEKYEPQIHCDGKKSQENPERQNAFSYLNQLILTWRVRKQ